MNRDKLTGIEKDVLREIGNIGAGNATTSMAALIQERIEMEVPAVHIVSINELIDEIGGPEEEIVAVLCKIEGEIVGTICFILTIEEAESIVEQMPMLEGLPLFKDGELHELSASVLKETANIVTGSYLSALADFTSLKMQPTVPFLSVDMAGATLVTGLVEVSQMTEYALVIDTVFRGTSKNKSAIGHFMLIPDPASIPTLLAVLGVQNE